MGLDNGINIKIKGNVPSFVKWAFPDFKYNPITDFTTGELVYFRKCWGIRNEIMRILDPVDTNGLGYFAIDAEDVLPIVKILMKYLDKKYYEDNADSIWEYDEMVDKLKQSIINLVWLKTAFDNWQVIECEFYDSY